MPRALRYLSPAAVALALLACFSFLTPATADADIRELKRRAESGNMQAQNNLGLAYHSGDGVAQDYTEAFQWYERAAEQGLAIGQHNLALMYDEGDGVDQDARLAAHWYRQAAEQGLSIAQNNLA
jgi:TPR repeat protein